MSEQTMPPTPEEEEKVEAFALPNDEDGEEDEEPDLTNAAAEGRPDPSTDIGARD